MRTDESIERPLHDLRVIEFEAIGPGPLAGRMLSDLGAQVTAVTRPTASPVDRELIGENTENELRKGKEIITLDLKVANGVIAALDLIAHSDALIEPCSQQHFLRWPSLVVLDWRWSEFFFGGLAMRPRTHCSKRSLPRYCQTPSESLRSVSITAATASVG
jgi:CoA-transferase family III